MKNEDLEILAMQLSFEVQIQEKNLILDWEGNIRPFGEGFQGISLRTTDTPQTILSKLRVFLGSREDGARIRSSLEKYSTLWKDTP